MFTIREISAIWKRLFIMSFYVPEAPSWYVNHAARKLGCSARKGIPSHFMRGFEPPESPASSSGKEILSSQKVSFCGQSHSASGGLNLLR